MPEALSNAAIACQRGWSSGSPPEIRTTRVCNLERLGSRRSTDASLTSALPLRQWSQVIHRELHRSVRYRVTSGKRWMRSLPEGSGRQAMFDTDNPPGSRGGNCSGGE
jgi:hypothetical protein